VGLAFADEISGTAQPLKTLPAVGVKPDWLGIEKAIAEWEPDLLIVGLPLNLDGTDQTNSQPVRTFGQKLQGRYRIPVVFVDERLSTKEAQRQQKESIVSGKRSKPMFTDAIAASLILQTWLDQQTSNRYDQTS
jgi:putative Holliday junction resolvase